ncbi:MAG: hypothetical protein KC560_16955 [Myxococcales bacterium]|nr:hypothetical protein [Myxococcales bacterium]
MTSPYAPPVELGSLLFTLVEPARDAAVAYHRWYERDHFYSGCLVGPGILSGRRFVATRDLKALRLPRPLPASSPLGDAMRGSYLALYAVMAGAHATFFDWAVERVNDLHACGRMFAAREHVQTEVCDYRGGVFRDDDGVPAALALDHDYPGLAVLCLEREPGVDDAALARWLDDELLGPRLAGSPIAQCQRFTPRPLPAGAPGDTQAEGRDAASRQSLVLAFLESDPRAAWRAHVAPLAGAIEREGVARLGWASPFVPTRAGTDAFADELW